MSWIKVALTTIMLILSSHLLASAADINVVARYGMRGDNVRLVQKYLTKAGYFNGKIDGVFGKKTLLAIKEFQSANHLYVDGLVGQQTLKELREYSQAAKKNNPAGDRYVSIKPAAGAVIPMIATAYTRYDAGCTDYTYRGNYLRRGLVAVDPNVIPLGTRLYIPGYGHAVADDIGGAIKGNRIDLAVDTVDEAFEYGVRHVDVVILP